MFSDQKAKEFVFEDSFEKLCMMITDEMEIIDKDAYSRPVENADDLIKWKKPKDELLEGLGGEATLIQRIARIERFVNSLNLNKYMRVKNAIEKLKKK